MPVQTGPAFPPLTTVIYFILPDEDQVAETPFLANRYATTLEDFAHETLTQCHNVSSCASILLSVIRTCVYGNSQ